jgi:hypothetical protein
MAVYKGLGEPLKSGDLKARGVPLARDRDLIIGIRPSIEVSRADQMVGFHRRSSRLETFATRYGVHILCVTV